MVEVMEVEWPSKVLATARKWYGPMRKNSQSYAPEVGMVWFTSNNYTIHTLIHPPHNTHINKPLR